jgi:hypothetical protein
MEVSICHNWRRQEKNIHSSITHNLKNKNCTKDRALHSTYPIINFSYFKNFYITSTIAVLDSSYNYCLIIHISICLFSFSFSLLFFLSNTPITPPNTKEPYTQTKEGEETPWRAMPNQVASLKIDLHACFVGTHATPTPQPL